MLAYLLFAQRHYRVVVTVVMVIGLALLMTGLQLEQGNNPVLGGKLVSAATGVELAGLVLLIAARRKAR